jgi:hypothetical protein
MIVGEGGVAQAASLDALARSLGYLKPWEKPRTELRPR